MNAVMVMSGNVGAKHYVSGRPEDHDFYLHWRSRRSLDARYLLGQHPEDSLDRSGRQLRRPPSLIVTLGRTQALGIVTNIELVVKCAKQMERCRGTLYKPTCDLVQYGKRLASANRSQLERANGERYHFNRAVQISAL